MIWSEAEARVWFEQQNVSRETIDRLDALSSLVRDENSRQNLVSAATLDQIWVRHFIDSAQLVGHDPNPAAAWLDLGSGAGFPGLVVAMLRLGQVALVETRKLRVAFLEQAVQHLALDNVTILGDRVERVPPTPYAAISARAFAPLPRLFELAHAFSTEKTRWILPKGRSAAAELEQAQITWQGEFRLAPSLTDEDARIVIAENVRRRPGGVKGRGS